MSTSTVENMVVDIEKMRGVVNLLDGLSQEGFGQIASVARLALSHLENPRAYDGGHEHIARALEAIVYRAEDIMNLINAEAEGVGCNFVDSGEERRAAAQMAARIVRATS